MAIIAENMKDQIYSIDRIGVLYAPIPSTVALAKFSYPDQYTIIKKIEKMTKKKIKIGRAYRADANYDQPNKNFMGPF